MLGWVTNLLQCDGEAGVTVKFAAAPTTQINLALLAADEHGVVLARPGNTADWLAYPWSAIAAIGPQKSD